MSQACGVAIPACTTAAITAPSHAALQGHLVGQVVLSFEDSIAARLSSEPSTTSQMFLLKATLISSSAQGTTACDILVDSVAQSISIHYESPVELTLTANMLLGC